MKKTNTYKILSGKEASNHYKEEIKKEVEKIVQDGHRPPSLAAILVGHDGGSETYVAAKMRACEEIGFKSSLVRFDSDVTQEELLHAIKDMNEDDSIDGFIVQLPLPKHIDEQLIIESVSPEKDVDGFHPYNVGKMCIGLDTFVSATPLGILSLLDYYNICIASRHVVVVGRSNIVGKPMANILLHKGHLGDATVTVCHSKTPNVKELTLQADILIAAVGIPEFIKGDMVKEGAIVIDVGTTRIKDSSKKSGFRLCGDVAFDEVSKKAYAITPVPGGVGPMTISSLMRNTLKAAKNRIK